MISTVRDALKGAVLGLVEYLRSQPLLAGLLVLAIGLFTAFFMLLGTLSPSSPGREVSLDQVLSSAREHQVKQATLLDEDARVEVQTRAGEQAWAAYPKSEGQTSRVIDAMVKGGASLSVDQQSGKATKRVIVQFLLPILILVTLFTLFTILAKGTGGASAFAAFSKFTGKGRKKGD